MPAPQREIRIPNSEIRKHLATPARSFGPSDFGFSYRLENSICPPAKIWYAMGERKRWR